MWYYYFLGIYTFINFILACKVYKSSKLFYSAKNVNEENEDGTTKMINLHDKYHPFAKTDELSFLRIFIGLNLFFWVKFIFLILNCVALIIFLKIGAKCRSNQTDLRGNRSYTEKTLKFFLAIENFFMGLKREVVRRQCEGIYKEYLGSDYKFTFDEGYSCIVSNHTGYIDIMSHIQSYSCGFIAKADVANIPLVGIVAKQIGCLFVKREDAENRHLILEQIEERQTSFLTGKNLDPLTIFPEGTVTSGKHIMKMKKGAFNALLPIKPITIHTTLSDSFHLSVGAGGLMNHFIRTLCYLYHNIRIAELPVITPNEFMYENYTREHPNITERWEIYAEVTREIMCRAGDFQKTEFTFRDSCEYANTVLGRIKTENKSNNTSKLVSQDNSHVDLNKSEKEKKEL